MTRRFQFSIFFLILLLALSSCSKPVISYHETSKMIDPHVKWTQLLTDDFYDTSASINILDIDMKNFEGEIELAWYPSELIITSEIAEEYGAFAAVNGSYFDMKVGGAWVFLQADGKQVSGNKSRAPFSYNAAYALDTAGVISIIKRPGDHWEYLSGYKHVMAAGPIMIYDNEVCEIDSVKFNLVRHPRTAVGITDDDHLILVTVDGRQQQAPGMNIPDLCRLMQELNCSYALNLDGGGSTTMYIEGEDHLGVVNYPTDNRKFDHAGQRPVSNAIVLIK
ncbi:MAG: phosphodiester glycosidase family protein [Candidatus Neomarinimicrobiota bacterium]